MSRHSSLVIIGQPLYIKAYVHSCLFLTEKKFTSEVKASWLSVWHLGLFLFAQILNYWPRLLAELLAMFCKTLVGKRSPDMLIGPHSTVRKNRTTHTQTAIRTVQIACFNQVVKNLNYTQEEIKSGLDKENIHYISTQESCVFQSHI